MTLVKVGGGVGLAHLRGVEGYALVFQLEDNAIRSLVGAQLDVALHTLGVGIVDDIDHSLLDGEVKAQQHVLGEAYHGGGLAHESLQPGHLFHVVLQHYAVDVLHLADAQDGEVVALLRAVGEPLHIAVQRLYDFPRRRLAYLLHDARQTVLAEELPLLVLSLGQSVGIYQQLAALGEIHGVALIVEALKDAQRDVRLRLQVGALARGAYQHGEVMAGIAIAQLVGLHVEHTYEGRDEHV